MLCQFMAAEQVPVSERNLRLTFEVFHDIEKLVVNIWLVGELHLDLVEIAQSILDWIVVSDTD